MANYRDLGIADAAFTAVGDLTSKQYYFVMPGSVAGEVKLANGTSGMAPIGILQNAPSAGQEAQVRVLGFSKLVVQVSTGASLLYGNFVVCASTGQGEGGASTNFAARLLDSALTTGSAVKQVLLLGGYSASLGSAS